MISVLLPCRNAERTVRAAAESVLDDLHRDDELVAVDDGSDDRTRAILDALAARDPRVVVIRTPVERRGIVSALATGLAAARGTLIGRMDADDVSLLGRFAAQRAMLARDPGLAAVGVRVELFTDEGSAVGDGMARYIAWQNALVTKDDHARAVFVEAPLCHPSTLIRRSALDEVGAFRDAPWPEDYDLWLRFAAAGFGLAKVPHTLFRWRIHASSVTRTDARASAERLLDARATYLARVLRARAAQATPFAVWGAGQTGRRLARALEAHDVRAAFFADIDPRKIGRIARGVPIVAAEDAIARAKRDEVFLVVAVGDIGARDVVRARLDAAGLTEARDYVCAA